MGNSFGIYNIQANELIYGNWVANRYHDVDIVGFKITGIFENKVTGYYANTPIDIRYKQDFVLPTAHLIGLSLTHEILNNAGFEINTEYQLPPNAVAYVKNGIALIGYPDKCIYFYEYTPKNKFKYVHQLQNIYFTLTGEKLNIKY